MHVKIISLWLRFFREVLFTSSCTPLGRVDVWKNSQDQALYGTAFYMQAAAYGWQLPDSLAIEWLLAGRVPSFLSGFVKAHTRITDSATGKTIRAHYFVSPDYVALGHDCDWARVPLTPMAAQRLADSLRCFSYPQNGRPYIPADKGKAGVHDYVCLSRQYPNYAPTTPYDRGTTPGKKRAYCRP